jgi:MFS family permease
MTTTAPAAQRVTYREVFAEPRFRLLLLTRSLAIGADTLRTVALSMLIFAVTGSPLLAAMTYGVAFLPQAIGGTLLGALADRVRPRPLITAGYGLEAATAAVLALAGLPVGASLALVAGIACLTPVFGGASSRLMAEALDGDAYVLARSLANIAASASQLLGLAAGGATVAALGTRHALLVTAACHLVAAAAVRVRLPSLPAAAKPAGQPPVSMLRQSWTVNRQLIADPAVRILLLATWLPPAFIVGAESLIVPYAAQHGFPAGSPGLVLACVPAGMIAGDFAAGRLLRPATREQLTIPPHDGGRATTPRFRRRPPAAGRGGPSGRYRHRPRLYPRDPAPLPGRGTRARPRPGIRAALNRPHDLPGRRAHPLRGSRRNHLSRRRNGARRSSYHRDRTRPASRVAQMTAPHCRAGQRPSRPTPRGGRESSRARSTSSALLR